MPIIDDGETGPAEVRADLALRGSAVLPQGLVPDALILVRGTEITWSGPAAAAPEHRADREITHEGLILPGLIDLHCHGGGGESFPDCADAEAARTAIREHRDHGTTGLVASLVTAAPDSLRERIEMLAPLVAAGELEGIHLEGPFISPQRKGAQNPEHIRGADPGLITELCTIAPGAVVTMTIAPESPGADRAIEALAACGVVPSLGHTDASSAQMQHAIDQSRRALSWRGVPRGPLPTATHLFNGMRPVHHRDPGPALACLDAAARGEMVIEVIADGVHLDAQTVRHAFGIAAADHVMLVTDAMAAAGMADGAYRLGSLDVTVRDAVATLTGDGAIAGGTAHLLDVVRYAVEHAGVDLLAAVRAASLVPARVLGAEHRLGSLAPGRRADVILADRTLRAQEVLRAGAILGGPTDA